MRLEWTPLALLVCSWVMVGSAAAATGSPSFRGLGDLPGGETSSAAYAVSADGSVVVGTSRSSSGSQGFRWTAVGGMVPISPGIARGVSADGTVVVGESSDRQLAWRWTAFGGRVQLGDLPGGHVRSLGPSVSGDGAVVVGTSSTDISYHDGFRWTASTGMVRLGDLGGNGFDRATVPQAVNADGSVVVGFGDSSAGRHAFRWTAGDGMQVLGGRPAGSSTSVARGVSRDGSVVVGSVNCNCYPSSGPDPRQGTEAFRWTAETGMVLLGRLPGSADYTSALGVSGDGSVVVGEAMMSDTSHEAFVWDDAHGMRSLKSVLAGYDLNVAGWSLANARAISADGRVIVGNGRNPNGNAEAWIAVIPEPAAAVPLLALVLPLLRRPRGEDQRGRCLL